VRAGSVAPALESCPQFLERVTTALHDVARDLVKGQAAIVVSSGGAIAAVTTALLGLPPEALIAFNRTSLNTGITKLAVGRGGINLISVNEHAHLEEAGSSLTTYR
jgi:broad specificity phosphatase PhoE